MTENEIGRHVVDAAIAVHREIGPGLLESVYEAVLAHELRQRGLQIKQQFPIAIKYRGIVLDKAFQADLIIDDKIIVELKCVENINNAHKKQLLTYLRLSGRKLGGCPRIEAVARGSHFESDFSIK